MPAWLAKPVLANSRSRKVAHVLRQLRLNTVCQSARCPNKGECFARGTATFMILGNSCTRGCLFCAVEGGKPSEVDSQEPGRIAQAVRSLGLRYVVITSVTRDDLPDGGSDHFAKVIKALRTSSPTSRIEVLTPDFQGNLGALATVIAASPDVFNHNIETVPRLYACLRPRADYRRSLILLEKAKRLNHNIVTKSGIMVGLGEQRNELQAVMQDLRQAGCDVLTLGQYLRPSPQHYPIRQFITPETFAQYQDIAQNLGFLHVYASPFARSSFHAGDIYNTFSQRRKTDEDQHHRKALRDHSSLGRSRPGTFANAQ
jgi:lipoic acid synthetase